MHIKEKINKALDFVYDNIGLAAYIVVWLILIITFWVSVRGTEAFGYTVIAFYLIYPVSSIAVGVFYGMGERRIKYILPVICGLLEMLGGFFTFQCANIIANGRWNTWNTPDLQMALYGFIPALFGLAIGVLVRFIRKKIISKRK